MSGKRKLLLGFVIVCVVALLGWLGFCLYAELKSGDGGSNQVLNNDDGATVGDGADNDANNGDNNNSNNGNDNDNSNGNNNNDNNNSNNNNNNNDNNNSGDIVYMEIEGTKKVGVLEFSNIRIGDMGRNRCVFEADVKNTSDEYLKATSIGITVIDENGDEQEVFGGVVSELAAREPSRFKTFVLKNIMDAADVKLEIDE